MYQELSQWNFTHGTIHYHETARIVTMKASSQTDLIQSSTSSSPQPSLPTVVIATAGTTDRPVAEEAAITLEAAGVTVDRLNDVGVAGLHRILQALPRLQDARVGCILVCAGMDGALPSVVGGLVSVPVVAVPTSIGYGVSFGGVSALLTMLNSCR
jgi:pyridinium-3,5-biscarboxylic acid mononucleotide synthase